MSVADLRDREKRTDALAAMLEAFTTEEGFARWAALRRHVHQYSFNNQVLLAMQAAERSVELTLVKAAWRWKRDGYYPEKGAQAFWVWTFYDRRRKDGTWRCCKRIQRGGECADCGKKAGYFKPGPVFDAHQVISFENGLRPPMNPPEYSIEGDELLPQLDALEGWAGGPEGPADSIFWEDDTGQDYGGFWRASDRSIHLVQKEHPNAVFRVLAHEVAHALGASSKVVDELDYATAEVMADAVAALVCQGQGLDVSANLSYMAHWGREEAAAKLREWGEEVDRIAKVIETAIATPIQEEACAA